MTDRVCVIDGCGRPLRARGWCKAHYERWRDHGDPMAGGRARNPGGECEIEGCERPHKARGWCIAHYKRWLRHGDPLSGRRPPNPDGACSVEGCDRPLLARGWCAAHYSRWRHHGDPMAGKRAHNPGGECQIEGCERPRSARGWCIAHYTRWRHHGDPGTRGAPTTLQCAVCDHPDNDDPTLGVVEVGRRLGVSHTAVTNHRKKDHDNDPQWHADRAAWWLRELATLTQYEPAP